MPRMSTETRSCCFREFGSGKGIVGLSSSSGRIGTDRERAGVSCEDALGQATDGTYGNYGTHVNYGTYATHGTSPISPMSPIGPIRSTPRSTVVPSGLLRRYAQTLHHLVIS